MPTRELVQFRGIPSVEEGSKMENKLVIMISLKS